MWRVGRIGDGVLLQQGAHHVLDLGVATSILGGSVVVDVLRVDDHFDRVGVVQLLELQRRELRLRRPATTKDVNLLRLVLLQ